jgi:hypothetical protein
MKPEPTTDAQLFDLVHELFGIGDWDRDLDAKAWHQVRGAEIAKVKAIRKRYNYSIPELAELARFVHDRQYRVAKTWDMLSHYGEFRRVRARERADNERRRLDQDYELALETERGRLDGDEWVTRLLVSTGIGREEVLRKWHEERQ